MASLGELESILRATPDAVVTSDASGRIRSWNPAAERLFGYPAEAILGESLDRIIPRRFRSEHQAGMKRAARGERRMTGKTVELTALRRDGAEVDIELSLADWMTPEGRMYAGIIRDISARKAAEREAEQFQRELEKEREALHRAQVQLVETDCRANLGCLLAGILHEMNTPLGAARCAADTMARLAASEAPDTESLASVAQLTRQGLDRITEVVRRLGELLRLSELPSGSCGVQSVIDGVVEGWELPEGVELSTAIAEEPLQVQASSRQLRFLIFALLTNATRAVEDHGRIRVTVSQVKEDIALCVSDDGVGMTPEELEAACKFGFTRDGGRVRLRTGLASVKGIIGALGGSLSLESQPHHGTTVLVRIPAARPCAGPHGARQLRSSQG